MLYDAFICVYELIYRDICSKMDCWSSTLIESVLVNKQQIVFELRPSWMM